MKCHAKSCLAFLFTFFLMLAQDARAADDYEFVKDTDRWIMVIQGKTESIGKLDDAGNFIPDIGYFQFRRGQPKSSVPVRTLINGKAEKEAYEYRSGRLVLGAIDDNGNFIPTVGAKVIDFKDYVYSPKAPRIYNLPGKLVRKGEKQNK